MEQQVPHVVAMVFLLTIFSPIGSHIGAVIRRARWRANRRAEGTAE